MTEKRLLGERILNKREGFLATGLEILVAGQLIKVTFPETLDHLKQTGSHLTRIYDLTGELMQDGNKEVSEKISELYDKDAKELAEQYKENETMLREAKRLKIQFEAVQKNIYEIGNDIKPDWWEENVDKVIIENYAKLMRALGKKEYKNLTDEELKAKPYQISENRKELYNMVEEFYKSKAAYEELLDKIIEEKQDQNILLLEENPKIKNYLDNTHSIEDQLLQGSFDSSTTQAVAEYKDTISPDIPYWTDYAFNPFMLAAVGVLFVKGAMRSFNLGFVDNRISKTICYPFKKTMNYIGGKNDKKRTPN